jgi:hypothetical protein
VSPGFLQGDFHHDVYDTRLTDVAQERNTNFDSWEMQSVLGAPSVDIAEIGSIRPRE